MGRSAIECVVISSFLLGMAACTSDDGDKGGQASAPDGAGNKGDAATAADARAPASEPDAASSAPDGGPVVTPRPTPATSDFEELMAYDWTLEAGQEQYYCVYQTVQEDLWISHFEPIEPAGTHHVTLGFVEDAPADGVITAGDGNTDFPCNGITLGDNLAFAAVKNTAGFSMPEGVAAKIPAGKHMLLSVHVFNGSEDVLTGRTGIKIVREDPANVHDVAENVFAANIGIQVGPGKSTQSSLCTMEADATILALGHHMHLTGVRQKTTLIRSNGEREVLLDAPFVFDSQQFEALDPPVRVKKGEQLEVECQFDNPTPDTYTFGESTGKNEMCLTSFYRFPAVNSSFLCTM